MTPTLSEIGLRAAGAGRRLRRGAADESGYVMVVALAVLVVSLAFATAALVSTLDTRSHATRDLRSQRALHAADAGVDEGLYRMNQLNLATLNFTSGLLGGGLGNFADCVVPKVNAQGVITGFGLQAEASLATGACALPSQSNLPGTIGDTVRVGDHGFYELAMLPGATQSGPNIVLHPKLVAAGVDDGGNTSTCSAPAAVVAATPHSGCVVRRVLATLAPIDPFQLVEAGGNLTLNGAVIAATGDLRTDGNLSIPGVCPVVCLGINSATVTGTNALNIPPGLTANITYGAAPFTFTHAGVWATVLETFTQQAGSVNRQPVTIDDTGCPSACVQPSLPPGVTAASLGGNRGALTAYDSTKDTVTLTSNTLSFTPGDYILCDFNATGGVVQTNIPAGSMTPVRIFVDSPSSSRCAGTGGQGNFTSTVGVQNVISGTTALAGSSQLQIYLAGNGAAHGTNVTISGGLTGLTYSMFLYAPLSDVTLSGAALVAGNYIGDDVTMSPFAGLALTLSENLGINNYSLANGVGVFRVSHYTECTPTYPLPANPTTGC